MNKNLAFVLLLVAAVVGFHFFQKKSQLPNQVVFENIPYNEMLRQDSGNLGTRVQYIPANQSQGLWTEAVVILQFQDPSRVQVDYQGLTQVFKSKGSTVLDVALTDGALAQCVAYPFNAGILQIDFAILIEGAQKAYRVSFIRRISGDEVKSFSVQELCEQLKSKAQSLQNIRIYLPGLN